jgi:hypothetical protein
MKRTPVESSNVKSIGYHAEKLTLEVEFHNGGVYQYYGVRPEHHAALMAAPSKGKHLHQHFRGKYETRLIVDEPEAKVDEKVDSRGNCER